jgi:hypothetical protein
MGRRLPKSPEIRLPANLTPKQGQALVALLHQPTIKQAAEAAGVPERTLYDWMHLPEFRRAYREARHESFSHAVTLTQQYASLAVNTLGKVMLDPAAQHSAKVSAATAMLRFGREALELEDLHGRVSAIEQTMRAMERSGT